MILSGYFYCSFAHEAILQYYIRVGTAGNAHLTTKTASIDAVVLIKNHGRMAF